MTSAATLYDIQGIQSRAHAERGIARYLLESASALERWHPGSVERFLLNHELGVPGSLEPLTASGRLELSDRLRIDGASIYHVGSPVELDVPLRKLWPTAAQRAGLRLVVTLYDLIPRLFADRYLRDPLVRRQYETRLELIRRADRVLAISAGTAGDAVEHLGIAPERVTVVGTGVSDRFQTTADRRAPLAAVQAALPSVAPGFVLYTGGIEPRKNIDALLEAYSALPVQVRTAHQLVVVCRVLPTERAVLDRKLKKLAVADQVVFTGFVPDDLLVALYQAAELFVFPSLYEGFGLPVAEALACGTPVACSRLPVLTELVDEPAAQFDPRDPRSIAEVLARCLSDEQLRTRLREAKLPPWVTWRSVADRTVEAYEAVAAAGRRPRQSRRRARVAWVSPLPPQRSGIADDSYRLLAELSSHVDIDAFADGEAQTGQAPPGISVRGTRSFHAAEAIAGGYDQVFYCLGNSEFHAGALTLLRERPGVVIAHDVRLSGLYGWIAANRPDLLPGGFKAALRGMYGKRLPPELGSRGGIDFWEANRHGVLMAQEAIAWSEAYLVHSTHAAQLARLDAAPADDHKVEVIPFRFPSPDEIAQVTGETGPAELLVGTFGLLSPVKQTERIVEAWALVVDEIGEARLAIVGSDFGNGEAARLAGLAENLGIGDRVMQTGDVDEADLNRWIARSTVAVQLRAGSNGETSAIVARCLATGTPLVVTGIGSARELSDETVVKVDPDVTPRQLADAIIGLLQAPERRASLARSGQRLARESSYERVAGLLYERHVEPRLRAA